MRDELRAQGGTFWFPHQYLHSVAHVPEPGCPPQRTGNIHHCIHFLCCCLLQKQITTNTAASNNTDAWFYSSIDQKSGSGPISLKSRCQQGCGPFQRLQRVFPCLFGLLAKFNSLDVIELRFHFLAACQLRVVSIFILWLVASFSIFKASNSLMRLSKSLVVKQRGQRNAKGPLVFVVRTLPDPGICSVLLELGWGRQKPTKNWSAMKYDMSLEGWCVYLDQAHILPNS